jgi:hypothetical protein
MGVAGSEWQSVALGNGPENPPDSQPPLRVAPKMGLDATPRGAITLGLFR